MRAFWLTAIGVHSEVAEMSGLFSGEMLQCMLGIYSKKNIDDCKELETSIRDDQNSDNNNMIENQTSLDQSTKSCNDSGFQHFSSLINDETTTDTNV